MKTIFHSASERGVAEHGWLQSRFSFSFADYYDAKKMGFGLLRVINDDIIEPAEGFGMHPHMNMEIVTIPLEGELEHKDNTGGGGVITPGEVQIMSAGTGIRHSEFNASATTPVKLLQLWVFPLKEDITPRYDQKRFEPGKFHNTIGSVVAPDDASALWINQNAWFSLSNLEENTNITYTTHNANSGVYCFLIEGEIFAADIKLMKRDALGVCDTGSFEVKAVSAARVLFVEVPMK